MTTPVICSVLNVFDSLEEARGLADRIGPNCCMPQPVTVAIVELRGPAPDYATRGYAIATDSGMREVSHQLRLKGDIRK